MKIPFVLQLISMFHVWQKKRQLMENLYEDYRSLAFLNFYDGLGQTFSDAEEALFQEYVAKGLTHEEVKKVIARRDTMVRFEG